MTFKRIFALRDFGIFLYLFPLRMVAAILPVKIVHLTGIFLGRIYSSIAHGRRKKIQERLTLVFKDTKTKEEIKKLSYQCLHNTISTYIDALILGRISKKNLFKCGKIYGLENLKKALSAQKGVIIVSGHFCGNLIAGRFLCEIGFQTLGVHNRYRYVYEPQKSLLENKYLKPYWAKVFSRALGDYVLIEDGDLGIKILRRLRENGLVNIHFDATSSGRLISRPFLGTERLFPVNFMRIVYSTGAAIIPMLCTGNSSSFNIFFEERVELRKASNKDEFISENLDTLVKILESQILQNPSQWLFMK